MHERFNLLRFRSKADVELFLIMCTLCLEDVELISGR